MSEKHPDASTKNKTIARRWVRPVLALLVLAGAVAAVHYGRYYVLPRRFAVVEPGKLYRSGYCEPGPLTRIIQKHGICTILTLLQYEPDSENERKEGAVAEKEGVRVLRIGMPGDGCARFDLLDQAADAIADPSNHPLLVHCAAGTNRTGAAYAAWRMRYCGWTYEQAMAEARQHNLSPESNDKLCEHLKRYYYERVTHRPGVGAPSGTPANASHPADA